MRFLLDIYPLQIAAIMNKDSRPHLVVSTFGSGLEIGGVGGIWKML